MKNEFQSKTSEETVGLGERLAGLFQGGEIICLFGDLGSGKTTFTKGIARGLKIKETAVNSPTFVLMNAYKGTLALYHFDLYRVEKANDVLGLGYEEFLYGEGVSVVEWAEKLGALFPAKCLEVHFKLVNENERAITFVARGERAEDLILRLNL